MRIVDKPGNANLPIGEWDMDKEKAGEKTANREIGVPKGREECRCGNQRFQRQIGVSGSLVTKYFRY